MTQDLNPGSSLIPNSLRIPRCGQWLPEDTWILRTWLCDLVDQVDKSLKPLHPVLKEFQALIEGDAILYMLFHEMFDQVPNHDAYSRDPFGSSQVRDYKHMLRLFNEILRRAPVFNDRELIGLPISAILDWPMGTPSGMTAFLNKKVNKQFKKMLDVWSEFLTSKDSAYVLNESQTGWLGPPAQAAMRLSASTKRRTKWSFETTFICNPGAPHFGFYSWDDFFTRKFRPGTRPIASPHDDSVIINPCEAAPYRIYRNVRKYDKFWVKGQNYSLFHMLAHNPLASSFIGGTIYQSFLDPTNYHRWHSPVSGKIVKAYVQAGTYFSQALVTGFPQSDIHPHSKHAKSPAVPSTSHAPPPLTDSGPAYMSPTYPTAVATRAIIFIEASNPSIGLMCVLPVGLSEVSSCDITVREGQHVKKGDELGMFHFGGSTCCLLFRAAVDLKFDLHGQEDIGLEAKNLMVNARIASVIRKKVRREGGVKKRASKVSAVKEVAFRGWREESFGKHGF